MLSPTDPLRSGQPSGKRDWQRINSLDAAAGREKDQRLSDRDTSARFYGLQFDDPTFHPLKIYRFPVCLRAAPNASTDYAKIRVHAGRYNGTKILNTDGHDLNPADSGYPDFPDLDYLPQESDGGDIQIPPNTSQYWVWVDISNTAVPLVKSGYLGQAVSGNVGSPPNNGWLQFPNADPNVVPIGWVDDATDAPNNNLYIRQFQKSDIWATAAANAGASGGVFCTLVASMKNYWICTPDGGATFLRVAVPQGMRAVSGDTRVGVTFTYAYGLVTGTSPSPTATTTYAKYATRASTATSGPNTGNVENQMLMPMPVIGWGMVAAPASASALGSIAIDTASGDNGTTYGPTTAGVNYLDEGNWGCEWFAPNVQSPLSSW